MQTRGPATVLGGRYELVEELGRSGTGMVWRAEDRLLDRTVTVKLIHPGLADDPAFAERLAQEARRVASLGAPGIARLLDSGVEDGVPFLVREHVEGVSARALLDRDGPLPPPEAARIAIGALDALSPAHEAGVLHLHLEPDDVLIAPDGTVHVTDLGIGPAVTGSRPADEAVRLLGGGCLAPEQAAGGAPGERTDVFAVGAVLFELLTGEPPSGLSSPRHVRSTVPRSLDRTVARALAPDPDERFPDVRAFAAALRAGAPPETEPGPPRRGAIRAWLGVPIAVAIVAAITIAVGLWVGRLEVGGPLGIRAADDAGDAATPPPVAVRTIRPVSVSVIDPYGDDHENDDDTPLAIDGDEATAWRSENYFDDTLNNKPGVGLVFDLGGTRDVAGFRLWTPSPGFGFQIAVGDDPAALADRIGEAFTARDETRVELRATGRYVLVWITSVVPVEDGNRAEIAEIRVEVVPDD